MKDPKQNIAIPYNRTVSFDDTARAFAHKDNNALERSHWLFRIMSSPTIVKLLSKVTAWSLKAGIPVEGIIRSTIFRHFCGGETIEDSTGVIESLGKSNIGAILDYSIEGEQKEESFERTKDEVVRIILFARDNPSIPYTSLKITGTGRFGLLEKISSGAALNEREEDELKKLKDRLRIICDNARQCQVPVYFDAEESWIQDAIDHLAEEMMRTYNKEKAIVLTTLQMYRWDRYEYLQKLISQARNENFFPGVKLVRGAYWEKENERASRLLYPTPVHSTKDATDHDFDKAVELCLNNIDIVTLCAGTHNEASTMHLVNTMKKLEIPNEHPHVYFSQLYGMSDHITYNLAGAGYNVTKYLPYGPIRSVIPYLVRRAEENTSIAGQMSRELKLITEEKKRRENAMLLSSPVK